MRTRAWLLTAWLAQPAFADPAADEYVFRLAGCAGCHTAEADAAEALAGGRDFVTEFGTFYSPNITPDVATGIGSWSEQDLTDAIRQGRGPHGQYYFPALPFTSYQLMSDEDAAAIYRHLTRQPPVNRPNRDHDIPWYLTWFGAIGWQWLYQPEPLSTPPTDDPVIQRGWYIANALGHCGECHTPRDGNGTSLVDQHLAGAPASSDHSDAAPNITPDTASGIGGWDADDLGYFLSTGATPSGDYTGGHMAEVVDNGLAYLSRPDRDALVAYLRSLDPIFNPAFERKPRSGGTDEFDF